MLFWFSADSPYGVEWGVAVTVADLARFILMALLFGAYFALWSCGQDRWRRAAWRARGARHGGLLAAAASVVGFSTGPCSVMGCGAPVLPVLGLAFTGLSSGTLALLARTSGVATTVVLAAMAVGIGYYGWLVGAAIRPGPGR
ncbi:MAG: hypothetical protein HY217_01735 [Candidatus Rokubacteria bacterium]|nr:hypothetical protein [Candidatus Rokubacteria bacterium]